MKKNYKTKNVIVNGVTYDEVFSRICNIFTNIRNGWDIAETYSKLYTAAKQGSTTMFVAIVKMELSDNVYCSKSFTETKAKAKYALAEDSGIVNYYKIDFSEDAFLEEIVPIPLSMSEMILETTKAYYETNKDVLSNEEIVSLEEQISYLTDIVKWEDKYSILHIAALINANDVAKDCSKRLEKVEKEYENTRDEKVYLEQCEMIETRLCDVWLNKEKDGGRCPVFFEDLKVPKNLRPFFDEIFIDC